MMLIQLETLPDINTKRRLTSDMAIIFSRYSIKDSGA